MFINQTLEKLHEMRLTGMAEAVSELLENPELSELSFEERLAWLVDRHWMWRENRSLKRRLSQAKLRDREASIEAIDFRRPRGLDRSQIRSLSNCDWVARHHNLIISGPYVRQSQLFRDLARARADGSLEKRFRQLARVEVLIVDDWAMAPLGENERRDFLEIAEDRYNTRSTILTSQIPVAQWHEQIGDPTFADSILDRLVHNAHRIQLSGESMRKATTITNTSKE
jgi:DNA replication protein DnaC